MHLVNMHTMIHENVSREEHKTDGGFYKRMPPVQRTLCKNVTFILRTAVDLDLSYKLPTYFSPLPSVKGPRTLYP